MILRVGLSRLLRTVAGPLGMLAAGACVDPHPPGGAAATTRAAGDPASTAPQRSGRVRFELASTGLPVAGIWKCTPCLGDVNGDGFLDVAAIARHDKGPRVWLGDGGKSWREAFDGLDYGPDPGFSCGGGVRFGDIDKDTHVDLIVADHCSGCFIFRGDGTGRWRRTPARFQLYDPSAHEGELEAAYAGTEDCAVADFDGDGFLDLVIAGSDKGGLGAYKGYGPSNQWTAAGDGLPNDNWANCLALADMNLDGHLDLVASFWGPRVWLGDGKGHWSEASVGLPSPQTGGIYRGVAVGDFNRDGRPDIVSANWIDGVEVFLQNADGSWAARIDALPQMRGGAVGVAVSDFDNDGNPDIIASGRMELKAGRYYGLFPLLGDGRGAFTWDRGTGLPETGLSWTWCFAVGDVDRDGREDFVVATGGSEPVSPDMPTTDVRERIQVWLTRSGG